MAVSRIFIVVAHLSPAADILPFVEAVLMTQKSLFYRELLVTQQETPSIFSCSGVSPSSSATFSMPSSSGSLLSLALIRKHDVLNIHF